MMETRLIPKKFLKLIKNLADENRNYKKIFGNVFWLEVVKEKNYSWFNLRLNSTSYRILNVFHCIYVISPMNFFNHGASWLVFQNFWWNSISPTGSTHLHSSFCITTVYLNYNSFKEKNQAKRH